MKTSYKLLAGITTLAIALNAQAYPGEGIVLDPSTGNYTITYRGNPNSTELSQTVFVTSTKVDPAIRSSFRLGEKGTIVYRYTESNGATAKQAIVGVVLDQIVNPIVGELPFPHRSTDMAIFNAYDAALKAAITSPAGWDGDITRLPSDNLDRISWRPSSNDLNTNGIPAGHTLSGFGFASPDLPGVGPSHMDGMGEVLGFADEGPVDDSAVLADLNRLRDNDFITRPAAAPMVAVPTPFNAAVLLNRIQTQMHTWIGLQLLDATFSSQLDRYFQSAISAYRLNQPKVGNQQIQAMLVLIKKEQPNAGNGESDSKGDSQNKNKPTLIDPLAARVLDFDLQYVMKRIDGADQGQASPGGTSPTLSVALSPATLWPPNGKLVPITAAVTVKNNNGSAQKVRLESITANETLADGDIQDAQLGTDDRNFSLLAKRAGNNQAGRIYTVTYSATDASGNKATASATVTVPHDQGK